MLVNNKSWFKYGCTCDKCLESKANSYRDAYHQYEAEGELNINFVEWATDDNEDYGLRLYINGHDCGEVFNDCNAVAERILEFLNIPAKVEYVGQEYIFLQ